MEGRQVSLGQGTGRPWHSAVIFCYVVGRLSVGNDLRN